MSRVWNFGRSGSGIVKIGVQFITKKSVLFRIPNEDLRNRVLEQKFCHVSSVPLVVQVWSPSTTNAQPDMSNIPLWVEFTGVPDMVFSEPGLRFLSNQVGIFSKLHPNTERCVKLDVARTLVVVNLEKPLKTELFIEGVTNLVSVTYPWLPDHCQCCQAWGYSAKECTSYVKILPSVNISTCASVSAKDLIHIVPTLHAPAGVSDSQEHRAVVPTSNTHAASLENSDTPSVVTQNSAANALKTLLTDLNAQSPVTTKIQENDSRAASHEDEGWTLPKKPSNRSSPHHSLSPKSAGSAPPSSSFAVLRELEESDNKDNSDVELSDSEKAVRDPNEDTEEGEITPLPSSTAHQVSKFSAKKKLHSQKPITSSKHQKKKQVSMSFKDLVKNVPLKKQSSKAPLGGR